MQIPVLVGILSTLLATDKLVTANELAEKFEISTKIKFSFWLFGRIISQMTYFVLTLNQ